MAWEQMEGFETVSGGAITAGARILATTQRKQILPLGDRVNIAAGATGELAVQVQKPQQADRLVLVSDGARGEVQVTDVFIGTRSQYAARGDVPIEAFSEVATGMALELDPAEVGNSVTVEMLNNAAAGVVVSGALLGPTAR